MKKLMMLLLITVFLLTGCAAKQEEEPAFAKPTPAIEKAEPMLTPEPKPTEKPYSEYNEMLKNTDVPYVNMPQVDDFGKHSLSAVESASSLIVLATVMKKEQMNKFFMNFI